jgi:hypothetical protein
MSSVSHQTIKLSRGKHTSPEEGACVMELASMLAGESFSDHPASVCPVIGSLLRAYNDWVDRERRQDLYEYAARVVGSRSQSAAVQSTRVAHVAAWAMQRRQRRWTRRLLPARLRVIGIERDAPVQVLGTHVIRSISKLNDDMHAAVLALIDELLAIGPIEKASAPTGSREGLTQGPDRLTDALGDIHLT